MKNLRLLPTAAERERRYFTRVLMLCGGDIAAAARVLGLPRSTAFRKLRNLRKEAPCKPVPLVCSMCGDWARGLRRNGSGQLTWDCRGGCNP